MEEYIRDLTEAQRAVEFVQEGWDLLQGRNFCSSDRMEPKMESIHENLGFIRSFLKWMQETSDDNEELQALVKQIRDEAAQLLDAANSCMSAVLETKAHDMPLMVKERYAQNRDRFFECSLGIDDLVEEIKSTEYVIKGGVFTVHQSAASDVREAGQSSRHNSSKESNSHALVEAEMIGFKDETKELLDRLTGNQEQREAISITGMAGIGKTTLAQRLYNDQSVVRHFHIRGWVSVSQVYQKSKLLSSILRCIPGQNDLPSSTNEIDIGEKLYRRLKGYRYLIVIDDIWDIGVWNDMQMYFPNDGNGSRFLITTRITDVASNACDSTPHRLRFLTAEESWDLFTRKVFSDKSCPHELMNIGKKIVAKCKGLPLAIVVVAGLLLKEERTHEIWSHVAQSIGSLLDSNPEQMIDILALSYEHLPEHLKLCFLHLGTFPEDYEIPFRKLIRSWIAEGYIKQTEEKELEDVAEDHLMELIARSLVIVAKKRSIGGIKTCHIHDMVRELCIRKALEKKLTVPPSSCGNWQFSPRKMVLYREKGSTSASSSARTWISFDIKFVRVLDSWEIEDDEFPTVILGLLHLKYLALQVPHISSLPRNLYFLWNLETFILQMEKGRRITLPYEIWKMKKLRHIYISSEFEFENARRGRREDNSCLQNTCFTAMSFSPVLNLGSFADPPELPRLQTISNLCPSGSVKKTLARTPALRKLGFRLISSNKGGQFSFPDLAGLKLLESVKFEYQTFGLKSIDLPRLHKFPRRLRKLSLIGSHVNWEQMYILGMLPNLQVLKIKDSFFSGPRWETREGGFRCLRFLKLSYMNLREWITSECHFPKLEQLVLNGCLDLVEIPSAIGNICTLQAIQVYGSSSSAADSAWKIQETQTDLGNDLLKVFIYPDFEEQISV